MNGNVSVGVSECRPSVIRWVGKKCDANVNSKTGDSSTLRTVQGQTVSTQNCKQSTVKSSHDKQNINNETSFLKSRNTEKMYWCIICKKSFKWRSHWQSHARIHTGERPFKCDICGKTFTRSDGLRCHKNIHFKTTEPCSTANQPSNIVQYVNGLNQNVFICDYCGSTFASSSGHCRHTKKKHKGLKDLFPYFSRPTSLEPSAYSITSKFGRCIEKLHLSILSIEGLQRYRA